MRFRSRLSYLALLFAAVHLYAQEKNIVTEKRCPVKTINYEQGLMSSSINAVITDAQGLTWVSTSTGIQRFNGYALQTITPVADGDTIAINYAVYFLNGKNKYMYIGYRNGVLSYDAGKNVFRKIISVPGSRSPDFVLMPLKETDEGIWCYDEQDGVVFYKRTDNLFKPAPALKNAQVTGLIHGEEYNISRRLFAANKSYLFLRSSANRILQVNTSTHEIKNIDYPGPTIAGLECDDEKLYIASYDGLACLRISDGSFSKKFLFSNITDIQNISRSTIQLTSDHQLLVSVEKRLYEFDTACICRREIVSLAREPLLASGYIQIVYEDKFRRIWLLTHEDIKRIQNVESPFGYLFYQGEKDRFVRALYYDNETKVLLAGTLAGAIELYDSSGNALWKDPVKDKRVSYLLSIEKISPENYLVMQANKAWYIFNIKEKSFHSFDPGNYAGIANISYYNNVQRINDSMIFIATRANVFRIGAQNNGIKIHGAILPDETVKDKTVSCFLYTSDKSLWAATSSNLIIRMDAEGNIYNVSIPETFIRTMAEDGNHNIWVGTETGIYIFNISGKLIKHISRASGLLSDIVYALQPADNSRHAFFASTNFGLSYISPEGKISNYTRELGLQENEFNTQCCARSSSGKIFFGGINGITSFYPFELSVARDSSEIHITRFAVNDSLYNSFGSPWETDSIRLPYNRNRIQFDIAATGLLNPDEYLYRYRIRGLGESWQVSNDATGIRYTLSPGKYTLEITCSPILFSTNTLSKKVVIIIDPPWWRTWWFIIIIVLVSIGLIFGISYYVTRQKYLLKLRRLEINQQLVNERERISRELHDNIGSQLSYISSNIDWLVEMPGPFNKEEEKKRLSVVNDTAKNLVDDLRETIWAMKKESISLEELADKLKFFLQSQCMMRPEMETVIAENIRKEYHFSPTETLNIFRICQEAIVNAVKHADAEKIYLAIESDERRDFSITIEDDGKGFVRQSQYNGHYGLENMTHRAAESGAKLTISSEPGKGTKVTVSKSSQGNSIHTK